MVGGRVGSMWVSYTQPPQILTTMKTCKLFSYKAEEYAKRNADIVYMKSTYNHGHLIITCHKPQVEKKPTLTSAGAKCGAWSLNSKPVFYKNGSIVARPKSNK